jgi:hypothetical protein
MAAMAAMAVATLPHGWRFFRAGGFDQVRLDSGADLLALSELDQKLWVALACPVRGIEFDARTLALIDSDGDGYIRAPELIAAVNWAASRLADAELLTAGQAGISVAAIRDDEALRPLREAARTLAAELGRGEDAVLSVEEAQAAEARRQARLEAAWTARREAVLLFGEQTEAAYAAVNAVREKVDDFFARCRLAAFDSRAGAALNASEDAFKALAAGSLQCESAAVAALPLARVDSGGELPLGGDLNPAWAARMALASELGMRPLLGEREHVNAADWQRVLEQFAPYAAWLAERPATGAEADKDTAPEAEAVRDLERLARYVRDLLPLANNFVAFRDFYTRQGKATFQVGALYLDGRCAELCVDVADPAKHAALAGLARICLVYCDCQRGGDKRSIAAAFTAGDADQLMVGRNGVFYDRQGRDWNATINRIVEHPISLRQAFWSPYKRLARMVGEQLQKLAGSRAKAVDERMAGAAAGAAKKVDAAGAPAPAAPPTAFDVGKFAGIFAAIGLAIGAIGTVLAAVVTGILSLHWWQMPLALGGLVLAISGPAVAMAGFKLHSRNLGPILDANGWAINARARINIPFGTSLTQLAALPEGAERSLTDPYAEKKPPWGFYLAIVLVAVVAGYFLVHWLQS